MMAFLDRWAVTMCMTGIVLVLLVAYWPRRPRGAQDTVLMEETRPLNSYPDWEQGTDPDMRAPGEDTHKMFASPTDWDELTKPKS